MHVFNLIAAYIVLVVQAVGMVATIFLIDRPRDPIDRGTATLTLGIGLLTIFVVSLALKGAF